MKHIYMGILTEYIGNRYRRWGATLALALFQFFFSFLFAMYERLSCVMIAVCPRGKIHALRLLRVSGCYAGKIRISLARRHCLWAFQY